ncbi:cupin domain-containing protein [Rhodomicrobium lacus]|uniref:cupin domain-containing protein n=1 Tax=Rhodomicrobium lacus TaxID=2498452 RepID=UPI000F8DF512|nr:cupin domain-containing protein [Rhodomicrobium lacus]
MTDRERSNIRSARIYSSAADAGSLEENASKQEAGAPSRLGDDAFRWDGVDVLAYKDEGSAPFRAITRQVLFQRPELSCELRYFEMAPGGHSTFERHDHVHGVMIFRGRGLCLVGEEVREVAAPDLVFIPPMTWHQFRASAGEPFGFLCMVNAERDKPQLPTPEELAELKKNPAIAAFLGQAD